MTAQAARNIPAPLNAGTKAPDFSMPTDEGDTVSLAGLKGKNIVLYFYPKDDTPGCTIEAKDFRDHIKEFGKFDTVVIGVSKDSIDSHGKFREKYCLPFPLASDESGAVCEAYGTWGEKSMYGKTYMGIERTTYLIDKTGTIRNVWRKVKVDGHVEEVLNTVKTM